MQPHACNRDEFFQFCPLVYYFHDGLLDDTRFPIALTKVAEWNGKALQVSLDRGR